MTKMNLEGVSFKVKVDVAYNNFMVRKNTSKTFLFQILNIGHFKFY